MIPPLPPASGPGQDGGKALITLRYDDVAQDGRLQLFSLVPGLGAAVWRDLLSPLPAIETFLAQGILPILRRLIIVAEDRPVSVNAPVTCEGSFRFAREKGGDRLFVNMWLEARAPIATTLGPTPPAGAPLELVGRAFAEHVITRPFGPPEERKVTRLEAEGVPPIPQDEHAFESAESLIENAGAPLTDAGDVLFGMMHTDSNQHVNSMVYPRMFEELAVRRMVEDARVEGAKALLARAVELRWRRPFFAGERARVGMAVVESAAGSAPDGPWKVGAVGSFHGGEGASAAKPSTAIQMWFR